MRLWSAFICSLSWRSMYMFEEGKNSSCLQQFYGQGSCLKTDTLKDFQLIAVTDAASCSRNLVEQVERIAVCPYKPQKLLLRAKELDADAYADLARKVLSICQKHNIELIIHTHWQAARELGISRLHMPLKLLAELPLEVRVLFSDGVHEDSYTTNTDQHTLSLPLLSTSVHSVVEAEQVLALGVNTLIAGHIYKTNCKAGVPPRGLVFLQNIATTCVKHTTPINNHYSQPHQPSTNFTLKNNIVNQSPIPLYAIGGIHFDPSQWQELQQNGANGACIMSAYMKI